ILGVGAGQPAPLHQRPVTGEGSVALAQAGTAAEAMHEQEAGVAAAETAPTAGIRLRGLNAVLQGGVKLAQEAHQPAAQRARQGWLAGRCGACYGGLSSAGHRTTSSGLASASALHPIRSASPRCGPALPG